MRSTGLDYSSFVKKLVFYHVGVKLEDHGFEGLRLLESRPEDFVEFVEATKVEVFHVVQIRIHILTHVLLWLDLWGYCRLRIDVVLAQT